MGFIDQLLNSSHAIEKEYEKDDYLLREGEAEQNIYFIKSGAVRIYRLSELEEQTVRLGYTGSMITSIASFLSGKPSEFYTQVLRKTTLIAISKFEFDKAVLGDNENLYEFNLILAATVSQQMEREIDLLTASPNERLQRVLKRSPQLFQEIPLKYIASYLRMTPETLSRLRNS